MDISKRRKNDLIRMQLEAERSSFIPHYRDLSDYILPRRARFSVSEANKGNRKNQNIIDSTATMASRTLSSGMMSGVTSPARPWFRLTTPDPDLAEFGAVKDWLHTVQVRMSNALLRSNLYNTLPIVYKDLGVFGTAPYIIEEDFGSVIHTQSFPVGSYMIAKDIKGRVNTFVREFRMTIRQLVEKFGKRNEKTGKYDLSNFSKMVQDEYARGQYETWVDVVHIIRPNDEYIPEKLESKFKKFSSCYYELGSSSKSGNHMIDEEGKFLRESGYDYFPVLCPRWEVTGEDVYGTDCPGMTALGDIKQLQLGEKRIAQAVEKMINPPLIGPSTLRNQKVSVLPGDITYDDTQSGSNGLRSIYDVNFQINPMEQKQDQIRNRIQRAFYEDLFLMLANSDRRQITAREIDERHEEKLLALGPVLEQLNQDSNDPLIEIVFDICMRQGLIPEPPEEVQGVNLKVEYVSIMAQAQKLIGIGAVERFAGFVSQVASASPNVLDKIDAEQMIDIYADMTSVPPSMVRTDEQVAEKRAQAAQAQAQAQQMEAMQAAASTAKDLSQADLEGENALTGLIKSANAGRIAEGA